MSREHPGWAPSLVLPIHPMGAPSPDVPWNWTFDPKCPCPMCDFLEKNWKLNFPSPFPEVPWNFSIVSVATHRLPGWDTSRFPRSGVSCGLRWSKRCGWKSYGVWTSPFAVQEWENEENTQTITNHRDTIWISDITWYHGELHIIAAWKKQQWIIFKIFQGLQFVIQPRKMGM